MNHNRYYHIGKSDLVLLINSERATDFEVRLMSPQDALHVNLHSSHATHINETSISATSDIHNQVYNHAVSDLKGHQVPDASSIILLSSEFFYKISYFFPE